MPDLIESYYIGVYWGIREEDVRTCAARASAMFHHLAGCDPIFQRWFTLGRSRKEALKHEVQTDPETLQGLLLKGRNRTDFSHHVIPELGYSLYLWNGRKDGEDAANINLQCGAFGSYSVNRCLIRLPQGEETRSHIMQISILTDILLDIVNIFQP